jgi:hypothetical protein
LATEAAPKLREQETTPSKIEGTAKDRVSCDSPECQAIGKQYVGLLFNAEGRGLTQEQRNTTEWRAKLDDFLGAMAAWHEDTGGTAAGLFREKTRFYSDLFNLASSGPDRERVLRATLDFLRQNRFQAESRIQWFLAVNALIGRIMMNPLDVTHAAQSLFQTDDPVIVLYARLERLLPRTPDKVLNLM